MKHSYFRFLALLLCLVTLVSLLPMAASAATLGKPTELQWNTASNWSTNPPSTMKLNGTILWKANQPLSDSNPTWFDIKVYRNGDFWFHHQTGYDNAYLAAYGLAEFNLTAPMNWESGKYYFTVQAMSDHDGTNGSAIAKSASFTYTKPSAKLAAPTNITWDFPYVTWTGPSGHQDNYHVEMLYSETANGKKQHVHSQWNIHDTRNAPPNFVIEEGFRPGYYHVHVRSISNDITKIQNSDWSNFVTYYYGGPEAPELSVSNVASTGKIKLSWKAVDNAVKYEIYRATSKSGSYSKLTTTTSTSATNNKIEAGKTYYYKVRAVDSAGNKSDFSAVKSRTCDLARPTVSLKNIASSGKINISWEPVAGAVKYAIYRSTSEDGEYTKLTTTTKTNINNTSTVAGQTYYYKVQALASSSSANSALSAAKSRTCDLARPTISLKNIASSGKINISWEPVDGAVKYAIYRSTSEDGEYTKLTTTTNTSINNTSTVAGQTYYYKVQALASSSSANSALSAAKSRTCDLARPTVTLSLNAKGKPVIQWNEVDGAEKYQIYRATSKDGEYTKLITTTRNPSANNTAASGQTYYYKVRAICSNSAATGAFSTVKSITTK